MSDAETKPPAEEQPVEQPPAEEQPAQEAPAEQQPAAEEQPAAADAPAEAEQQPAEEAPAAEGEAEAAEPGEKAASPKQAAEGEEVKKEPVGFNKAVGECYEEDWIDKPIEDSKISRRNIRFYNLMSQQSRKRYNVHFLEDDQIIYVTGNKYQTYHLDTKEIKTYDGLDTDGVGSVCVHRSKRYFAVAEKGIWPNIYIRQNPGYKTYRILRKGTELSYAHVEFSPSGDKLVSLGGRPDYTLTVWDWRKERVILKCRAYGQDVYRCQFSPFSDDILFTGGSGHIRFWKMAQTFTGLKLQGEIAKYGGLELSDATGWQELKDGKIVSGTEYGTMVLWEGNLVKAHLVADENNKPLHNGHIEVCLLDEEKDMIITAATDGYIKWWSREQIDAAEADEHPEVPIDCKREVLIKTESGEPAHIINIVRGNGLWLLSDVKGRLWRINPENMEARVILEYHSGSITDMVVSDAYNMALSCAEDGTVKVWDYTRAEAYYSQKFIGRANCIDLMRRSEQNKGRVAVVGFESGLVRTLELSDTGIDLAMVMKAHDGPVDFVKYAPDQMTLVTASRNGEIFFFDINGHLDLGKCVPICQLVIKDCGKINDLRWDAKSENILLCTQAGYVHEIRRPDPSKLDVSDSYLIEDYPMRTWKMKMMEFQMKKNQKKDEEEEERKRRARLRGELKDDGEEEEEDWDPESITKVCYNESNDPANNFIIGATGQYKGFFYLCNFDSPRPLTAIPMNPDWEIQQLSFNQSGEILIMCFDNAEIRLMNINYPDRFLQIKQHDAHAGGISSVKFTFDERALISAGRDGILFVHTLDKYMITQESNFNPLEGVAGIDFMPEAQVQEVIAERTKNFQTANEANIPDYDPTVDGLDETLFSVSLRGFPDVCQDITDTSIYSIQQAKLRTEEDARLKLAEEKKQGVRRKIDQLRQEFSALIQENDKQEEVIKVSQDDFNIDPEYFEMLLNQNAEKIEETKKEVAWNIEWNTVALNKLKSKFYDVLDFEKYTVKAMRNVHYVTTFRVPKMSEFLNRNIEQFRQLIAQEVAAKENFADDDDEDGLEDENKDADKKKNDKPKVQTVSNVNKTEAEKKREARKVEREVRKKKIEKLVKKEAMISTHDDISKNPRIEEAKATYGDMKLQMSPEYEVPENKSINFSKKRQQMVLLEGSIHKLKVDFNNKIVDQKERKKQIIEEIEQMNKRITEINGTLGVEEELFLPVIDEKSEYPQRFFDVNDKEIDDYREYKIKKAAEEAAAAKGGKKKTAAAKAAEEKEAEELRKKAEEERQKQEEASKPKMKPTHNNINPYLNAVPPRKGHKNMSTDLDEEYDQIMRIELEFEKQQLKTECQQKIDDFDTDIKEMQKEKYRLESDLKNAEIKLILLFEELILLKSMEQKDQELTHQLTSNRQDKGEIMKEITEITKKLKEKKREIDNIKHEEEQLLIKFHEYCPEGSAKYNDIRKFYERITKKRRKVEAKEKNEDDDDEEEGEAEQEEEEEQEQEDEDEDPAIAGLSQEDFKIDEIEKIRDERCQLYDAKEKIGIYITDLEGTRKKMENRERQINQDLGDTEEEIRDFQKEKMSKLNQLQVSVVLKIKQIQNLHRTGKVLNWQQVRDRKFEDDCFAINQDDNLEQEEKDYHLQELQKRYQQEDYRGFYLPETLDDSVLITRNQLLQLIERKRELDDINRDLRKQQDEDKKKEKEKRREIQENMKEMAEAKREYEERQMLRFGNLIDLDSLEVSGPSQAILDKQMEFQKTEKKCIRDIEEKEAEHQKIQRELTDCIQRNTDLLDMIRKEVEKEQTLNKQLDANNKAIFADDKNKEQIDRQVKKEQFKQTLEKQAKEIDILKTEINLYKRKGGHIYTKVTTNRRVAHLNQDN